MAIARSNAQTFTDTVGGSSYTVSGYTVATELSSRILIVRVSAMRTSVTAFTLSATYNGVSMTSAVNIAGSSTSRYYQAYIFYLVDPPAGAAYDVVISASASIQGYCGEVCTLTGGKQTSPVGITNTGSATSTPLTANLDGVTAGSLVLAVCCSNSTSTPTWTWSTDVIEDFDLNNGNDSAEVSGSGASYLVPPGDTLAGVRAQSSASPPRTVVCAAEFFGVNSLLPSRRPPTYVRL